MIIEGIDKKIVAAEIKTYFDDWKIARSAKEVIWQDCVNNYLTVIDESKYENWPWRSKVCDTMSQETADTIASALRNALFPLTEDYFTLKGIDKLGITYAEKMTEYVKSKLKEAKFQEKMRVFLKQFAVLGNSVVLIPWVKNTINKKKRVSENGKVFVKTVKKSTYDNFDVEILDMLDVVFDPNKAYTNKSMCIYRAYKSLTELKSNKNYDAEGIEFLESGYAEYKQKTDSVVDKSKRSEAFGLAYDPSTEDIELLVSYGDYEYDGVVYEDYMAVVGNGSILLRFEPNPYWGGKPVLLGTYDPMWFSSYGRGPLEPILGVQELINTFTNQKADILNLIIMGSFAYVNDGIIDPESLFLRPAGGIEVGDINNIKPLAPNGNVALTYQEISMLRERGERSSAASNYEVGVPGGGRKTAFEASILKQGSAGRFGDVVKHTGDGVIESMLEFIVESLKQFKYGSGEIDDEALLGEYSVDYYGADTSIVRQTMLQSLLGFLDISARMPEMQEAIDPLKLSSTLKRLLGLTEDITKTQEEIDAERQRKQSMEMALVQAKQGGMGPGGPPGGMEGAIPEGMPL